jgi:Hemerythrin HHE cation binding domain
MTIGVPRSIAADHKDLRARLEEVLRRGGRTGAAAGRLRERLRPHFEKEESFALPPLGLVEELADGGVPSDADAAIAMAERLRQERAGMLRDHASIVEALAVLRDAATEEKRPQAIELADALTLHGRLEEEILYPAAILVGEFLKLKRSR